VCLVEPVGLGGDKCIVDFNEVVILIGANRVLDAGML